MIGSQPEIRGPQRVRDEDLGALGGHKSKVKYHKRQLFLRLVWFDGSGVRYDHL